MNKDKRIQVMESVAKSNTEELIDKLSSAIGDIADGLPGVVNLIMSIAVSKDDVCRKIFRGNILDLCKLLKEEGITGVVIWDTYKLLAKQDVAVFLKIFLGVELTLIRNDDVIGWCKQYNAIVAKAVDVALLEVDTVILLNEH